MKGSPTERETKIVSREWAAAAQLLQIRRPRVIKALKSLAQSAIMIALMYILKKSSR